MEGVAIKIIGFSLLSQDSSAHYRILDLLNSSKPQYVEMSVLIVLTFLQAHSEVLDVTVQYISQKATEEMSHCSPRRTEDSQETPDSNHR